MIEEKEQSEMSKLVEEVIEEASNRTPDKRCKNCNSKGATDRGLCMKCVTDAASCFFNAGHLKIGIPTEFEFYDKETGIQSEFLHAPELAQIGKKLLNNYLELSHLEDAEIIYLWKLKGGASGGKSTLGKCVLAKSLVGFFSEADFIIWLGADNLQGVSPKTLEAVVYHELLHAGKNDDGKWFIVPHEFEGFSKEIERYGMWREDMEPIKDAFFQLSLFEKK